MKPSILLFLLFAGTLPIYAQPANDNFADAIDVPGIINSCSSDAQSILLLPLHQTLVLVRAEIIQNVWFSFVAITTTIKVTVDIDWWN